MFGFDFFYFDFVVKKIPVDVDKNVVPRPAARDVLSALDFVHFAARAFPSHLKQAFLPFRCTVVVYFIPQLVKIVLFNARQSL